MYSTAQTPLRLQLRFAHFPAAPPTGAPVSSSPLIPPTGSWCRAGIPNAIGKSSRAGYWLKDDNEGDGESKEWMGMQESRELVDADDLGWTVIQWPLW